MKCWKNTIWLSCLIAASFGLPGCGESKAPQQTAKVEAHADHPGHVDGDEKEHKDGDGHKHAEGEAKEGKEGHGWWCDEHGVPEAECALCNSKVAADFKKKADWCKDHDRPDSQCFKCHPEKLTEFAQKYVAKYGKEPPKPELE